MQIWLPSRRFFISDILSVHLNQSPSFFVFLKWSFVMTIKNSNKISGRKDFKLHVCMIIIRYLTHLCLANFPILINWMSPFPILGLSGVLFHFYSISNRNSYKQTVKTLIDAAFCGVRSGPALFAYVPKMGR